MMHSELFVADWTWLFILTADFKIREEKAIQKSLGTYDRFQGRVGAADKNPEVACTFRFLIKLSEKVTYKKVSGNPTPYVHRNNKFTKKVSYVLMCKYRYGAYVFQTK